MSRGFSMARATTETVPTGSAAPVDAIVVTTVPAASTVPATRPIPTRLRFDPALSLTCDLMATSAVQLRDRRHAHAQDRHRAPSTGPGVRSGFTAVKRTA